MYSVQSPVFGRKRTDLCAFGAALGQFGVPLQRTLTKISVDLPAPDNPGGIAGPLATVPQAPTANDLGAYDLRTCERIASGLPSLSLNAAIHSSVPSACRWIICGAPRNSMPLSRSFAWASRMSVTLK